MFRRQPIFVAVLICVSLIVCSSGQAASTFSIPAYQYTGHIRIDLRKMPFSSYGSYMAVSAFPNGVYLRELHNNSGQGALTANALHIELVANGKSIPFTERASPVLMHLTSAAGTVDICFAEPNLIRLRSRGIIIRLTSETGGNYAIPATNGEWELHGRSNYRLGVIKGAVEVTQHWNGKTAAPILAEFRPDPAGDVDAFVGDYLQVWQDPPGLHGTFDDAANSASARYDTWLTKMPSVATEFGPAAEAAAYLSWSSIVAPGGFLKRPAMMMSKNWMAGVWSWDNCFNAMALMASDPETAWDQFMLPFDNQHASGQLPDVMNDETESWRHTKPPVHGWVLRWMMSHSSSIDRKKLNQIYGPLCRWTDWFFRNRDADRDGLPEYNQGDDSGWDNTTIFLEPPPIEAPDLAALLVVQMDVLSDVAAKLGRHGDAASWRKRSDELLKALLEKYWHGDQFVALHGFDHKPTPTTSLILYLPLILGQRLPEPIRRQLIDRLMENGRFLTQHGFATEELGSPYYCSNGYWRGPIWAPTMMMLAQGLEDAGRLDLARDMRLRFCRMAAESGFAENFNAVTGAGSVLPDLKKPDNDGRDPAYTWASSVFLIFAHQLSSARLSQGGR